MYINVLVAVTLTINNVNFDNSVKLLTCLVSSAGCSAKFQITFTSLLEFKSTVNREIYLAHNDLK